MGGSSYSARRQRMARGRPRGVHDPPLFPAGRLCSVPPGVRSGGCPLRTEGLEGPLQTRLEVERRSPAQHLACSPVREPEWLQAGLEADGDEDLRKLEVPAKHRAEGE